MSVTPLSDDLQPVDPDEPTQWEFDVLALRGGTHRLLLRVTAMLGEDAKSIPVIEREIVVKVAPV